MSPQYGLVSSLSTVCLYIVIMLFQICTPKDCSFLQNLNLTPEPTKSASHPICSQQMVDAAFPKNQDFSGRHMSSIKWRIIKWVHVCIKLLCSHCITTANVQSDNIKVFVLHKVLATSTLSPKYIKRLYYNVSADEFYSL